MVYVGIDLGGTSIKAGLVDEQGKILCKATCPTLVERGARLLQPLRKVPHRVVCLLHKLPFTRFLRRWN